MTNRYNHIQTILAAIFMGCFFVFTGCENDINIVKNLGKKKLGVDEARQVETYMSQDGKTKAKLVAPLMLLTQDEYGKKIEYPKTLRVDFFDDTLHIQSKLFALYGTYSERENKILLKDSVIIFNIKGDTLICKELTWDQATQRFTTDKQIFISQSSPARQRLFGIGFSSDQNLTDVHIGHVQPGSFFIVPDSSTIK
ncbi:MAG: LPS export ABC transporter periplasmic protein LptC [Chitinophagaceae bacterium]|nr:LPS export ABC transporter periplasmic protein LptC [Chitinophagaceae bacterium]